MYRDKKIVVVMPAYNAAKTLPQTYAEVRDQGVVDKIILV
ncbi:MAG TPA: glycosyltransferase, partial [Verrucomicrobiae bacterium]